MLGLTAALIAVAGFASWVTVASPGGRSDAAAQVDLLVALSRAQGADRKPDLELVMLPGQSASDAPNRPSVEATGGFWFGAAKSASGRCFVLAWRFDGASDPLGGTLAKSDQCTGVEVRARLGKRLESAGAPKRP